MEGAAQQCRPLDRGDEPDREIARVALAHEAKLFLGPAALHAASEGIGIASRVAATLPSDAASELTGTANDAFVDAMTPWFVISTAVLLAALVVAVTMIPRRMRAAQAGATDDTTDGFGDELVTHELQPELAN